ncbi:hypothetical protein E9993_07155 [Labilibacter sediminis]|nr:hypothetical protein E9993_07155 [Labilibacter sediminis]
MLNSKIKKLTDLHTEIESPAVLALLANEFCSDNKSDCTFRDVKYINDVLSDIINTINQNGDIKDLQIFLIEQIIEHNVNTSSIYNYIIKEIKTWYHNFENYNLRIKKLRYLEKRISQIVVNKDKGYCPNRETLKNSIYKWIKKEVGFYEKNYLIGNLPENKIENLVSQIPLNKIKTNLSVAQIASFLRHLIDQNIIETNNKETTIKIFSKILSSKNAHNISDRSLRAKFFNPDLATLEDTKQMFLNLFKSLNTN